MEKTAVSFFPSKMLLSVDKKLVEDEKIFHSRNPDEIVKYVLSQHRKKRGNNMGTEKTNDHILNALLRLEKYVKIHDYSGYDPYDALNSEWLEFLKNKFIRIFFTQLFVYSPINLRRFFAINPEGNPKAIGIFLQAYCKLFKAGLIKESDFRFIYKKLADYLISNSSDGYSGRGWGFNFNWQDPTRYSKKGLPTIVVTSYVANSFLDLYEITRDKYIKRY